MGGQKRHEDGHGFRGGGDRSSRAGGQSIAPNLASRWGKYVLCIATQFNNRTGRRGRNERSGARTTSSGAPLSTVLTKSFPQEKPAAANTAAHRKRVVIVGGGFAGIAAARALKRSNVDVLLLD